MVINVLNERHRKRLYRAMNHSFDRMLPFKRRRQEAFKQYTGFQYSDDSLTDRSPMNLLELATNITLSDLASKNPSVIVTTPHLVLRPTAADMEIAMNYMLEKIRLGKTIEMAVLNAIFSMGVVKTGLCESGYVVIDGEKYTLNEPFADVVELGNWVFDMTATTFGQVQFAGDRFRPLYDKVMESDQVNKKAKEYLKPTEGFDNIKGDNETALSKLSQGTTINREEYRRRIDLWSLWLREEKLIAVVDATNESIPPLEEIPWEGPDRGPYHILTFNDVPENIMPLSPASLWLDMHELANAIFRKLGRQAERQKTIVGVQSGAEKDANRIIKAYDGDVIKLDNPNNTKEYRFGGPDNVSFMFLLQLKELFSYLEGNLDIRGGLSPQTETVGQETLMAQSASRRVVRMQNSVMSFAEEIIHDLGWYLFYDPLIELPLIKKIKGSEEIEIPINFSAEERSGEYMDYNLKITPYSMRDQSPADKLKILTMFFQQFYAPFAPQMMEQGIVPDFEKITRLVAKYTNMPELTELLTFQAPSELEARGPIGEPPQRPPVTIRVNERINRPGAIRTQKDQAMMAALMGSQRQPAEMATMTRPVS